LHAVHLIDVRETYTYMTVNRPTGNSKPIHKLYCSTIKKTETVKQKPADTHISTIAVKAK